MSLNVVTHLNFRSQAREALTFYHSVFGGALTIVTYADMHNVEDPADADHVMWGEVNVENGFRVMGYDVQSGRTFDRGDRSFYVALRGQTIDEVKKAWAALSKDAKILQPLEAAPFAPLYGMLTDRFGITWIVDVATEHVAKTDNRSGESKRPPVASWHPAQSRRLADDAGKRQRSIAYGATRRWCAMERLGDEIDARAPR